MPPVPAAAPGYPKLRKHLDTSRVILFTSENSGTVVVPDSDQRAGKHADDWESSFYTDLPAGSEVTLTAK